MTYLVLARKWRPRSFDTLVGQDHVVRALTHALDTQRLHHAWLFTGTRGVGKTTLSRILAKSLNCETGITSKPCGVCRACTEIDAGRFIDYVELDAASNRGVEEMTQLLEQAVYAPSSGRYKVYMIDEVHMLTGHAFNAMLKTLEEPPAHVKFILATTDPQKIPVTVLSRCLQFNLKQMTVPAIVGHLQDILTQEEMQFELPALRLLAQAADGSMRDALSLSDQAIAYSAGDLSAQAVQAMLGTIDQRHLAQLLQALVAYDAQAIMGVADDLALRGLSYSGALADLATLLSRIAIEQRIPGTISDDDPLAEAVRQLAPMLSPDHVQLFYSVAVHSRQELSLAPDEYAGFVMACLRMLALLPEPVSAYVPPPVGPSGSDTAGAGVGVGVGVGVGAAQAAPAPAAAPAASELASAPATSTAPVDAAASAAPQQAQASAPAAAPVADVASAHAAQAAPVAESIPADDDFVPAWEDAPEPDGAQASSDSSESAPADASFEAGSATSQPQEAATAVADSSAVEAAQAASTPSAQPAAEPTSAAQADSSADPVAESPKAQGKSSAQPLMSSQAQAAARVDPVAEEAPPAVSTQDGPEEPAWLSEGMDEEFENYQPLDMDAARAEEDGDVPSVSLSDRFMPDTELGLPVPQSGSDSPRTVRLGGMKPETWPEVATSLPLSGWAAELARQSEWLGVKGQEIHLRAKIKATEGSQGKARLRTVLSEYFAQSIQLVIEYGDTGDATAHAVEQAKLAERQRQAEEQVAQDPFVLSLIQDFDGSVKAGSIKATPLVRAA
ncbi:DNA polymerase III subunit gamma/tau [Alcaligenes nematophilus]|uniref:DNA polymerase III subunit gamma/tau n=1 Tax=Alcaligenes nematophilus TaxID=2994643 RepID=A0ABU3MNA6_9BURK|nr:DNA polymerase III subunit gamma/tau [Alcaligenes nematophilus]MDT8464147.1 DNA polymerase III subunit gamma/tau [Alcaligenes nematophilus]MDT8467909.1 DNA polymerase III subunit gamma/tau [Alcaligenes nematophilus]MDT8503254.1 DNA polymerase III subunit gamma/tau [Alcaligenes nematophilus]MDT8523513.1 DNA polymerase III subunit gamma/tau [Alcaligenes nematophilus]